MRARLLAVGTRPPGWVREAYADYSRRLGSRLKLALVEIEPGPRSAGQSARKAIEAEARKLMGALRPEDWVVALDERGTERSTRELADWLAGRMREGRDLAFLIGGPDGLAQEVRQRSNDTLSLSRLTLPHALVRVVLAEQLYRALSILTHHPYHRDGSP
jgi:23S rRNA (pseudouridine1915-N3)-methyltransferase